MLIVECRWWLICVLIVQFLNFFFEYLYNKNVYKRKMKLELDYIETNKLARFSAALIIVI